MIGLETAPLTLGDVGAATRVWRECEQHDQGEAMFTEEDIFAVAKRPRFDFERDSAGVRDDGRLVALGLLRDERHAFAHVLPAYRGRGIGSWLLRWTQDAGRAAGHRSTGQTIYDGCEAVARMLRADGYTPRWESWAFEIGLSREPGAPRLPAGYAIRDLVPGSDDERATHRVIEEAFGEWPERDPCPFDDWEAETLGRPGFTPRDVPLVVRGDEVVGAAVLLDDEYLGWVDQLAFARPHRGRGLAGALLVHAFGIAWRAGKRRCGLSTDSRTGARGLYEHVGMRVKRSYTQYAKPL